MITFRRMWLGATVAVLVLFAGACLLDLSRRSNPYSTMMKRQPEELVLLISEPGRDHYYYIKDAGEARKMIGALGEGPEYGMNETGNQVNAIYVRFKGDGTFYHVAHFDERGDDLGRAAAAQLRQLVSERPPELNMDDGSLQFFLNHRGQWPPKT